MPVIRMGGDADARQDLRKEKRVPVHLNMHLKGIDGQDLPVDFQIVTENISRGGLCFRALGEVAVNPGERIHGTLENRQVRTRVAMEIKWKADDRIGAQLHLYSDPWLIR